MKKLFAAAVLFFSLLITGTSYGMIDASSGPESATWETAGTAAASAASGSGRQLDPSKPMIAITYDDGPCTTVGNRIMDVYLQYGQRCTFFVVGNRVSSRASELQRMASEGFEIGNHSWSHKYLTKYDASVIRSEVEQCNEAVRQAAGVTPSVMRLPGGCKNSTVLANVGMPVVLWNIDTLDWKTRNAQSTVNAVLGKVKDGDVILMHELYSASAEATEILVPKLVEQGFQLVTVSELAACKGKTLQTGTVFYSF